MTRRVIALESVHRTSVRILWTVVRTGNLENGRRILLTQLYLFSYFGNKATQRPRPTKRVFDKSDTGEEPTKKSRKCDSLSAKQIEVQESTNDHSDEKSSKKSSNSNNDESKERGKFFKLFQKQFPDLKHDEVHNYYFCTHCNCNEICSYDLKAMSKDKKFQHKWH